MGDATFENATAARERRDKDRLSIAISLLQGRLVVRPRDGYDPGGFQRTEMERTVGGALDMAEELLGQNDCYGGHDWVAQRMGGDPTMEEANERVLICKRCGKEASHD